MSISIIIKEEDFGSKLIRIIESNSQTSNVLNKVTNALNLREVNHFILKTSRIK